MQTRVRSAILGVGGLVLLLGGLASLLAVVDLSPLAGWYATRLAGRPVTIASARVAWTHGLTLELRDVRIANPAWVAAPDLLHVEALSAVIEPGSLLAATPRLTRLTLRRPVLRLERAADGRPNWRADAARRHPADPAGKRHSLPTVLDLVLQDGRFLYRGTGGSELQLDLERLSVRAGGDATPLTLALKGRYNGIAVTGEATGDSYDVLHDPTRPFGTRAIVTTPATRLRFTGAMTAPLDFDGVQGELQLETRALDELLALVGLDAATALPVSLTGALDRKGDLWRLAAAGGRVADSGFAGELTLHEGGRGAPDAVSLDLRFPKLNVMPILASLGPAGREDRPLRIDMTPGVTVDARIAAAELTALGAAAADLELRARLLPGLVTLDAPRLTVAGGHLSASLSARPGPVSRVAAQALLTGGDVAQLARLVGRARIPLTGRVDAGISLDASASTAAAALRAARGQGVVAMTRGRVERDLLETVSTDLRSLFRRGDGWAELRCLLGVIELRDGHAVVSPLRLRTADTSLTAAGQVDLLARRLDLTVKSGRAPGPFALRVPLRLRGPLGRPDIEPQLGASADWLDMPERAAPLGRLPPELARLIQGNACAA